MKKVLFLVLGFIVASAILVFLTKGFIVKIGMEQAVTRLTGFQTKIRTLKYDLPSTIRIQDLEILNPPEFEAKVFAKVPEVYISFFAREFFLGKGVHFGEIRLHVQEVYIEKNPKGVSNVDLLNLAGVGPEQMWRLAKRMPFLVDRLELTLRQVSYEDYFGVTATSGSPYQYSADLDVENKIYLKIDDPQTLVNLVLYEILRHATFKKLLDLGPAKLLSGAFSAGQAFAGDQAHTLSDQAGSAFQSSVSGTKSVLSGFWGKLKSIIPGKKTTSRS